MPVYKYKTNSGIRFYVKYSISGHTTCKRGFETKTEAIIYEASMLKKNRKKLKTFYVKDLFKPYCSLLKTKMKITSAYSKIQKLRNHIFPYFENIKVKDVTSTYLNYIADSINNKEYKRKNILFSLLKEFLEYLMNYGLDREINMSMLYEKYNSSAVINEFDFYTRDEFNRFISVIDNVKYKLIFILLFDYGLRIGELLGLKHCDFENNKVRIRRCIACKLGCGQVEIKPKTKSSVREYPLIETVRVAYLNYIATIANLKSSDYLFKANNYKQLTLGETPIRNAQKRYEKISGLKHIKIHEFRHSCASELINNGFSPEQVASWLGHSSSITTMRVYGHLYPSRKMAIATYYNSLQNDLNSIKTVSQVNKKSIKTYQKNYKKY